MCWLASRMALLAPRPLRLLPQLAAAAILLLGLLAAQQELWGQISGPGIRFRNDLKTPIIVQGVSLLGNLQRRGQPFLVAPGKTAWDNNLAMGMRFYTIYDANLQRILLRDRPVRIQTADQFFSIQIPAGGPTQVKMESEAIPTP